MTPAPRLTDRKRDAIIQAAISEFRANGFDTTSMDKIADRAEVSKRTVYNHFPSKEDLFAEILLQLWSNTAAQIDWTYRADRPLREQLYELLQAKMRMLNDASFLDMAKIVLAATIHSPERAQEIVARLSQREAGVDAWIRAAQSDGKLRDADPCLASHQLQGLLKTFAFWPQVVMGQAPLSPDMQKAVVESALDMFLTYYAKVA